MTDASVSCVKLIGWDRNSHSKVSPPFVDLMIQVETPTTRDRYKVRCTDVSDTSSTDTYNYTFNYSHFSPVELSHETTMAVKHLAAVYHRLIWGRPQDPNL